MNCNRNRIVWPREIIIPADRFMGTEAFLLLLFDRNVQLYLKQPWTNMVSDPIVWL